MSKQEKPSPENQVASVVSLPGYEIKDVLGKGGMAVVYLAVQKSIGRQVALKILASDHTDDSFTDRFLREAKIVSSLTHPNIITIYDAGVHQGCHFMAMEYVPGKNLRDARDLLNRKHKIAIIKQIAQALDYAGKKGYVHRDIKPENILLHEDGRAILTDFGIARSQNATQGLTITGKVIGTPYYMSPEQTKGVKVDHRSDIYSLGIVLFQALAGYVPYDGPSLVAIGIKHLSDPIPELPPGMDIFQPIINICLSKDPEHRYQTAGEFLKALNQISEADIDFLNAKSAANKKLGKDHQAKTISTSSNPILAADQIKNKLKTTQDKNQVSASSESNTAKEFNYDVTTSDDFIRLGRRKRILVWLLLLTSLAGAGYYKQDFLIEAWQTYVEPKIIQYTKQTPEQPVDNNKAINEPVTSSDSLTEPPIAAPLSSLEPTQIEKSKPISGFALSPDENTDKIKQLTLSNHKLLQANPADDLAKNRLMKIANWYILQTSNAMENYDHARARFLLAQANETLPDAFIPQKLVQLDNQLLRREAIQGHMQRATEYIQKGAFIAPDNKNALAELQAVLSIDPNNTQAQNELKKIAEHYYTTAKSHKAADKPHEALASIELGLKVDLSHTGLLNLKQSLQQKIQLQEKLMSILIQAEAQFQAGKVILPKEGSATSLYKQVLREQKENKNARAGLQKSEDYVIKQIQTAIWKKKFTQAEKILKAALSEFPNSTRVDQAHKKFITAKTSSAPRVTHLLVSDQPFSTLLTEQKILSVTPTLHLGFTYTNLSKDTTALDLKLDSVTENQTVIEKKLLVSEATGDQIFTLKHPIATFIPGEYQIVISLDGNPLITQIFNIRAKPSTVNPP